MAEIMSPKLSVNVNKIATIRNARGGNNPNVLQVALDCERFGAQGITVHPRPDERHIRFTDVHDLSTNIATEFNIEGYPSEDFLQLIEKVKPHQVTLVPDPPHVLTSNAGWDTITHQEFLTQTIARIKLAGARVSIFLDPNPDLIASANATGTDRIELYTEAYASQFHQNPATAIAPYVATANAALEAGLGINAGHDLDLHNLRYLAQNLPGLAEVSIGHALVCDALYHGLQNTIQLYLRALKTH
ncbi:MAG: pyridoxine 5'-phosphate synthase [Bacteroidota bacterium]